jgi:hypothetical protein
MTMKTLLLSVVALAVATAPVFGEDQDQPKQPKNRSNNAPAAPPRKAYNPPRTVPRTVPPKVQQNFPANTQPKQPKPPVTKSNFPKGYTPEAQARMHTKPPGFTPPNQDMPRNNPNTAATTKTWQNNNNNRNRDRTDSTVTPPNTDRRTPNTTVQSNNSSRNRNSQNRDWQNRTNQNRNWQNNNNTSGIFTYDQARRHHHREHHNRSWWRSHYNRIALFAGGYYYWDNNYWYPAYGYDPYYSTYTYDEPIYGYNELPPGQVIANVQSALQEQGYYRDSVDGLIGPNTRAALRNFQRDRGLPITAAIDGPTLQALGLD